MQGSIKADPVSFPFIHQCYIEKQAEKEKLVEDEKVKKNEVELYEETQMEKLKTFVNTFYKSKNVVGEEKNNMMETLKAEIMIQTEINDTKQFLETKIPEMLKDTSDKIMIKNKEVFKKLPHPESANVAKKK